MIRVDIVTSDNKIWDKEKVYTELALAVNSKQPFVIDLLLEAPDLNNLGLYQYLESSGTDLENITIRTSNAMEKHNRIHIDYCPPVHLLNNAKDYIIDISKKQTLKPFGMFIGRSNAPRLHLATYLKQNYHNKSLLSYHFNVNDDFHSNNIGLEDLIKYYNFHNVQQEAEFISHCPITLEDRSTVYNNKNLKLNHAQQLFNNDRDCFSQVYDDFFVELVCESFFTGNTFFPTEKIFRPILLKTPFIVQGPQNFLHNLKKLGFKTFDAWWDEGYSEDPDGYQIIGIKQVLDFLSTKTSAELYKMYQAMSHVLDHNYQTAMSLTQEDFKKLHE